VYAGGFKVLEKFTCKFSGVSYDKFYFADEQVPGQVVSNLCQNNAPHDVLVPCEEGVVCVSLRCGKTPKEPGALRNDQQHLVRKTGPSGFTKPGRKESPTNRQKVACLMQVCEEFLRSDASKFTDCEYAAASGAGCISPTLLDLLFYKHSARKRPVVMNLKLSRRQRNQNHRLRDVCCWPTRTS